MIHDGLGEDHFFVAETAKGLAFSNRCWPILALLGLAPELDRTAWRYWFCMGWFPGNATPYANIRFLDPGESIVADAHTVSFTCADTLSHWIRRGVPGDRARWMDRAAESVRGVMAQNRPATGTYEADLTGGLDSRAICALLTGDALRCRYNTGGEPFSPDVVLARRIAKQLHLDWRHVQPTRLTHRPDLPDPVAARFRDMTLWGEGMVEPARFHHFSGAPSPTRETVYLSGGVGEISKAHYYRNLLGRNPTAPFELDRSVGHILQGAAGLLRDRDAADLRELVGQQVREGLAHDLADWSLLDFFYLRERARRWQSAHLAINLFDGTVLPFLAADHITLAFVMRPIDKARAEFQRYIIRRNHPALLSMPLAAELPMHWRLASWIAGRRWAPGIAGQAEYFREGGRGSVDRILAGDAPHWEILDRPRTMQAWNDFTRGSTRDVRLPLALLAFAHWHDLAARGLAA